MLGLIVTDIALGMMTVFASERYVLDARCIMSVT